jgi:hypothetical protein
MPTTRSIFLAIFLGFTKNTESINKKNPKRVKKINTK